MKKSCIKNKKRYIIYKEQQNCSTEEILMIIEIRAKNCFAFDEQISFSMKADMRNRKFASNVHKENNFNILKTAGIYGPNNAGKTCLIKCIKAIRQILLNKKPGLMTNIFTDSSICELGVTFLGFGRKFSYDFKYDAEKKRICL